MSNNVFSPAERAMQNKKILELKLAGWRQSDIATELGLSPVVVSLRLRKSIEQVIVPAAEDLRKEEIARLDKYLKALEADIEEMRLPKDRAAAVNTAVRVAERRAKLLGLDMPTQIEVKHEMQGSIEAEIERLSAELAMPVSITESDDFSGKTE